jgi:ubiquitin-protein ligase
MLSAIDVLLKRTAERDFPLRTLALDVVGALTRRFASGQDVLVQSVDLESLLRDGVLRCGLAGPSGVFALLHGLLPHATLRAALLYECCRMLPHVRKLAATPARMEELLTLLFDAAASQPLVAIEALRGELLSLSRFLLASPDRQSYACLYARYGLGGLPLEEGCFDLQGALGSRASRVLPRGFSHGAPLSLKLVEGMPRDAASGDICAVLKAPMDADGVVFRRHHLVCHRSAGYVILEPPSPIWLTGVAFSSASTVHGVDIVVYAQIEEDQTTTLAEVPLLSASLIPLNSASSGAEGGNSEAGDDSRSPASPEGSNRSRASQTVALQCRRILVRWRLHDPPTEPEPAPPEQLFTTPPDGLGHVMVKSGLPTDGAPGGNPGGMSAMVTPLKHGGGLGPTSFSSPYTRGQGAPKRAADAYPLDIALTLRLAVFGHLLFLDEQMLTGAEERPMAAAFQPLELRKGARLLARPPRPYRLADDTYLNAYHTMIEEEDAASQAELSRRQYCLRELLEATRIHTDKDSGGMIEVAHGSCCEMQAEAVCTRWTLRQFRANHVFMGEPLPALLQCDTDRAFLTAEGLVHHYLEFASQNPLAEQCVLVRDLNDACALYDAFCHEQPPGLGDAVFELLKRSPALDQQAWASFILHALEGKFGADASDSFASTSPAFFEPLRAIAQRHHLTQPSMYNPLLMAIVEYARRPTAALTVAEAAFYLLASSLPVLAVAAAGQSGGGAHFGGGQSTSAAAIGSMASTRDNAQIIVFMIDANRCRTQFRIRRTTPLHKMFQAFCELKDVSRRECEFLWHGQPLDGNQNAAQLGLGHEDSVQVVWRPTQTVRPALSQQRQLDLLGVNAGPVDGGHDGATQDGMAAVEAGDATAHLSLVEMAAAKTDMFYTGASDGRPLEIFMTPAREMGSRLGAIPAGASLKVLACSGDWAKIRTGALVGWCHVRGQGPSLFTTDPRPALALSRKRWYKVTTMVGDGGLEVRVAPRLTAAIVGHIFAGQRVQARQVPGEEWLEIDLHRQTRAFVLAKRDRNVYAVPDETQTDTTAHVIVEVVPCDELRNRGASSPLEPRQMFFSRMTCVAEVLLTYCRSIGQPFDTFALYLRGAPLLGYLTLAEAAVSSGDCLELRPRPAQGIPDNFVTVVVRNGDDHVIVKLLRGASVSCVCDQYCVRKQAEGQETMFTFRGQPVLPYDTPTSLGLRDMDILEASIAGLEAPSPLLPAASHDDGDVASVETSPRRDADDVRSGGTASVGSELSDELSERKARPSGDEKNGASVPVPAKVASTCKGIAMTYFESLRGASQSLDEQMEEHAKLSHTERENLAAAMQNKIGSLQGSLDSPDVVPGTLPEVEEFLPLHLIALAASRRMLEPPSRQLLILICHVLERISLNCSWRSLMWVFRHDRFEAFLRAVGRSEDVELQEAVTHMAVALCEHISTLSDARCCDAETVHVVAPHSLVRYTALVRSLVDELLASEAGIAKLSYSRQLPFLLHLIVPRHGVASSLTVDYHPHSLAVSRRKMPWRCHACNTAFDAEDGTMRFRCSQGCDFNLCVDCLPYANPEFAQQVVSWASLERLLGVVAARRLYPGSRQDARLAVLALTLARWADPRKVIDAAATWQALEACALSPSEAVGLQLRGAMRALLQTLLSHAHLAQQATREVLRLVSRTLARDPRPSAPLLLDMLDSLTEQGATILCADVDTLLTLTDAIGQLAAVTQTGIADEKGAWVSSAVHVLQHLQCLLLTALESCQASQLLDISAGEPESDAMRQLASPIQKKKVRSQRVSRVAAGTTAAADCNDLNVVNLLGPATCENIVAALMAVSEPAGPRGVGKITAEATTAMRRQEKSADPAENSKTYGDGDGLEGGSRSNSGCSSGVDQMRLFDPAVDTPTACGRDDSPVRLLHAVMRAVVSASEASAQALVRTYIARRFDVAAHNPESPALSILTLALRRPAVVLDFVQKLDGLGFLLNLIEASGRGAVTSALAGGSSSATAGRQGAEAPLTLNLHGQEVSFYFTSATPAADFTAVRVLQQVLCTAQAYSEVQTALAEDEKLLRLFMTIARQAPRFHCLAEDVLNGLGTLRFDLANEVARHLLRPPYHSAKARALAHLAATQTKPSRRAWAPELAKLLLEQRQSLEGVTSYLHALAGELRDSTVGQVVEKAPLWPELLAALLKWLVGTYQHFDIATVTRPGFVWSLNWPTSDEQSQDEVGFGWSHVCSSHTRAFLTAGCRVRLRVGTAAGHHALPRGAEGTFVSMQAGIRWDIAPQQLVAMVPLHLLELAPNAATVAVGDTAYVSKDVAFLTRQQGLPWHEWRDGDLAGKLVTVYELLPGRRAVRVAANGVSCVVAANALRPMLTGMAENRVRDRTEACIAAWSVVHPLLSGPVSSTVEDRLDVVIRVFRPAGSWGTVQTQVEANALALCHAALLVGPLKRALLDDGHSFGQMAQDGLRQGLQSMPSAQLWDMQTKAEPSAGVPQRTPRHGPRQRPPLPDAALESYGWLLFWAHLAPYPSVAHVARGIATPERVLEMVQHLAGEGSGDLHPFEMLLAPLEMLTAALWSRQMNSLQTLSASAAAPAAGHEGSICRWDVVPSRLLRRWWSLDGHAVHITMKQRPGVAQPNSLNVPADWLLGQRPDGAIFLSVPPETTVADLTKRLYGPGSLSASVRREVLCCGCRLHIDDRIFNEDAEIYLAGPDTHGQPLRMRIDVIFAGTIWVSTLDGAARHFVVHASDLQAGVWTAPLDQELASFSGEDKTWAEQQESGPSLMTLLAPEDQCHNLAVNFGVGEDRHLIMEVFIVGPGDRVTLALRHGAPAPPPPQQDPVARSAVVPATAVAAATTTSSEPAPTSTGAADLFAAVSDEEEPRLIVSCNPVLESAIAGGHLKRLASRFSAGTRSSAATWGPWLHKFIRLCELPHFAVQALRSPSVASSFWALLGETYDGAGHQEQVTGVAVDTMTDVIDEVLVHVIQASGSPISALEALKQGIAPQAVERLASQTGELSTSTSDKAVAESWDAGLHGAVKLPELGVALWHAQMVSTESTNTLLSLGSADNEDLVGCALWSGHALSARGDALPRAEDGDRYVEVVWAEQEGSRGAKRASLGTTSLTVAGTDTTSMLGEAGADAVSHGLELHSGRLCAGDDRQPMAIMSPMASGEILGCGIKGDLVYFSRNGHLVAGFHSVSHRTPLHLAITGTNGAHVALITQPAAMAFTREQREAVSVDALVADGLVCAPAAGLLAEGNNLTLGHGTHAWDAAGADQRRAKRVWRDMMQLKLLHAVLDGAQRLPEATRLAFDFLRSSQGTRLGAYLAERLENDSFNDMSRHRALYTALAHVLEAVAALDGEGAASWLRPLAAKMGAQAQRARTYLHVSNVSGGAQALLSTEGDSGDIARLAKALVNAHRAVTTVLEKADQAQRSGAGREASCVAPALSLPGAQAEGGGAAGPVEARYYNALRRWSLCFLEGFFGDGHYFESKLGEALPRATTSALSSELTDAREGLPCNPSNAVFFAVTDVQLNLLKVLVTGVEGTPYSGGCFIFDVYCPPEYPRGPPKVMLATTGHGSVRFNPNLYNNGKVCLSLLGTWEGEGGEAWTASSSLLQVFASIQSLIMTSGVYFNEPGYEHLAGTAEGEALNQGYANIVKYATVKYAMLEMLRCPPRSFEYVVRAHFYHRRNEIAAQCRRWLEEAGQPPCTEAHYGKLVAAHNASLAAKFKADPLAFQAHLRTVVEDVCEKLGALTEPEPPADSDVEDASDESDEEDE